MKATIIFLVIFLLSLPQIQSRKRSALNQQQETSEAKKTVAQADHFYSATETSKSFNITNIIKDKSVVFTLKPQNDKSDDKTLSDNPITIQLSSGSDNQKCTFDNYHSLCALPKITEALVKLTVSCKKTPCQASWILLQPPTLLDDGNHTVDQLVEVNDDENHAILKVVCNNPDLRKTLADDLELFTASRFKKLSSKIGEVYYLFSNQQKGYYYLTTKNEKVRSCITAQLKHISSDLPFNDDKFQLYDFIAPFEANTYTFKTIPDTDFRLQCSAHDSQFAELKNTTGLSVKLVGHKGGDQKTINQISFLVDDEKKYIDFSLVYKKLTEKYDKLTLELKSIQKTLIIQMRFIAKDVQEVEIGEESFFDLKKGDKINYKFVQASNLTNASKVNIFTTDDGKLFKLSTNSCDKGGCQFTLECIADGKGNIYIGESSVKNTSELIINQIKDKTGTKKVREGEQVYYSYQFKAKSAFQIVVNTPGVLGYAASKEKCPTIDEEKCYEKTFTYHNPTIYQPLSDGTLIIKVIALDNTEFTITIITFDQQYVTLKDTIPFVYLMDDQQTNVMFGFKLDTKQDVSFNLISAVNQLNLYVTNGDKYDEDSAQLSSDGFIKFEKTNINNLNFVVKVEKRQQYKTKYVHFTLIVSTKESNLRLEPGVAHYETLHTKDSRDYVFQFQPKKSINLNFYTHNIKSNVNLKLQVSNADQYTNANSTAQFTIDKQTDVLEMSLVTKRLCKMNEGQNCELFVRITNQMDVEADVTITLIVNNALIELKDGIWQTYNINFLSMTSHFYFFPKHQNRSVTIFYKSTMVDLRMMYVLWKSDDQSIDPTEWPFPTQFIQNEKHSQLTGKPTQFIHVEQDKLKECWPDCLILLSLVPDIENAKKNIGNMSNFDFTNQQFRIMASNNYVQLPQKHKVQLAMNKDEEKNLLVDLKYYLQKDSLEFFTHFAIGSIKITGNVYSQKNPRCPVFDEEADFQFSGLDTALLMQNIKQKLDSNDMSDHRNIYICLTAHAFAESKFSIEFTSESGSVKKLTADTTSTAIINTGQTQFFQVDASQQFYLKITRNQGLPYINKAFCKDPKSVEQCFEDLKQSQDKGEQLLTKMTLITFPACSQCVMYVKVYSEAQAVILLHSQSRFGEVELVQNNPLTDELAADEQNIYSLTAAKDEQIIINIQITTGDLKVQVHDYQTISITKTNPKGEKNIHITIPAKDMAKKSQLGKSYMETYSLSSFSNVKVIVMSQDLKVPASYTITYSSGDPIVYLQDGLISQYNLIQKKKTSFIYNSPYLKSMYLHLGAKDSQTLNKLTYKMYSLNGSDLDQKITITPEKPDFKKKTPNPTMFIKLPPFQFYFFEITNNNNQDVLFTIGINNAEVIHLPFDHQFPVQLKPLEYIYIITTVTSPGYVRLTFSKCDESQPYIAYTQDYTQFSQEQFSVQQQMVQQMISDYVIHVKSSGGVYLRIKSPQGFISLLTLKATFSPTKIQSNRAKPGDKGNMRYQLLDSATAELTFTGVTCPSTDKACNKNFNYVALISDQLQNVYAQLVCPNFSFDLDYIQQIKSPDTVAIPTGSMSNNKITFKQSFKGNIQFVGVKATNSKTGQIVYYRPVQIVTFWGQLSKLSTRNRLFFGILIAVFLIAALVVFRRWKKGKQYKPLDEIDT